jgi:hypothetical protein
VSLNFATNTIVEYQEALLYRLLLSCFSTTINVKLKQTLFS